MRAISIVVILLAASFLGLTQAGELTTTTIKLVSQDGGTVVILTSVPDPNGNGGYIAVTATLPDGTQLSGIGKLPPQGDGSWVGDIELTKPDIDGSGILPLPGGIKWKLRVNANEDEEDTNPDEQAGDLIIDAPGLGGDGARELYY